VLDGGDDNPSPRRVDGPDGPGNGQVVGFGGATGEDDLAGRRANGGSHLTPGLLDSGLRLPSPLVSGRGRIAEVFREVRQHPLEDPRIEGRRGVAVEIDGRARHARHYPPPGAVIRS
jgi:hypothetical protein